MTAPAALLSSFRRKVLAFGWWPRELSYPPPKKKKKVAKSGRKRTNLNMFETVQNKIRSWSVCQYKLSSATCCIFLSGRQQLRVAFISYMTFFVIPLHRRRVSELSKSLWFDSVLTEIFRTLLRMFSLVGKWSHTFSKSLDKFHGPKWNIHGIFQRWTEESPKKNNLMNEGVHKLPSKPLVHWKNGWKRDERFSLR